MALDLTAIGYKGPSKTIADATYEGLNSLASVGYIVPQKDIQSLAPVVLSHASRCRDEGGNYVVIAHMEAK